MNYLLWADALLIVAFAVAIAYFVLLLYMNSLVAPERKNKLRNSFPYEFYRNFPVGARSLLYVLVTADGLALALGSCFFFLSIGTSYAYVLLILFALAAIAMVLSNVLPLSFYKGHLFYALLSFFAYTLGAILLCFATVVPGAVHFPSTFSVPILVVVGIFGFAFFLALFNPKLTQWAKMDRTEENGATYYVKPKVNALSLYEWIFLVLFNLTGLLLFLNGVVRP